jgi:hypothetical protein
VRVGAEIEDVAGNNLQRLFDVDLTDPATRPRDNLSVESIPCSHRAEQASATESLAKNQKQPRIYTEKATDFDGRIIRV